MKSVVNFLENLLYKNDKLVIGLSGGPDSMCLLHVLMDLKEKYNLTIICAHVNHGLRIESNEEEKIVEKYCQDNNLIFEYLKIDGYKDNKFSEEEARRKRYKFFDDTIKKYNANYLMTAHHGDDLIETILMRIVRGSTISGYGGIPKISCNKDYKIVRPLLYVDKKEIMEYIKKNNIPYCIDKSNENEKYTRNRYRKHILPFLKKEDSMVHLKFLQYSEELEKSSNYLNKIVLNKIKDIYVDNKVIIGKFLEEDEFIQEKIIEYVIKDIQKTEIFNVSQKHLKSIINLASQKNNKKINLSNDFIARKSYNYLIIEKNKNTIDYHYEFKDKLTILNTYTFSKIESSTSKSNYVIRLNSQELTMPLFIRNKKEGDKMLVKNLNGSKKVKDIFIDSKIDLQKRGEYPLLVDAKDNIIWVPGIKKSTFDKENNENYDIIVKYTEEENE